MTTTVTPPARTAPKWAAPSMPTAPPLTTIMPPAASPAARQAAFRFPPSVARRVPTSPKAGRSCQSGASPRQNRASGGPAISRSLWGYAASSGVSTQSLPAQALRRVSAAPSSCLSSSPGRPANPMAASSFSPAACMASGRRPSSRMRPAARCPKGTAACSQIQYNRLSNPHPPRVLKCRHPACIFYATRPGLFLRPHQLPKYDSRRHGGVERFRPPSHRDGQPSAAGRGGFRP